MSNSPGTQIDFSKYQAPPQIDFSQYETAAQPPKTYAPGREFGEDVARGMGLDADKIKAAEDKGGTGEAFKEIGSQVWEGLSGFAKKVAKDPAHLADPVNAMASGLTTALGLPDKPGDSYGTPSIGKTVGALANIFGATEGAKKVAAVPEATAAARETFGGAIHDTEGDLTPGVKATSKAVGAGVGAAAGHAVGGPVGGAAGAAAGYAAGPALIDKMFPEPADIAETRRQSEVYEQRAQDLMRRGKEQEALDRKAAAQAKLAAKNAPTTQTPAGIALKPGGTIVDPSSAPPPINKTLVSYPREALAEMAKGGDLNALRELIRNPGSVDISTAVPNSKFLLEGNQPTRIYGGPGPETNPTTSTATNPRTVIRFDAQGKPLVQLAAPSTGSAAADYLNSLGREAPEVEVGGGKTAANASGESSASLEAQRRIASEKAAGVQRVRIDTRTGKEIPLTGVDAVDAKAGPYDEIITRDKNGNETTLDRGDKARPRRKSQ